MWNGSGPAAIVGVHSDGDCTTNFGSAFFDEEGLKALFGEKQYEDFVNK